MKFIFYAWAMILIPLFSLHARDEVWVACREFKRAMVEANLEKLQQSLSLEFKSKHKDQISTIEFFRQPDRMINKIMAKKYRASGPLILKTAQIQVLRSGEDVRATCRLKRNGEDQEPELYTIRELRMLLEEGEWRVDSWRAISAW